MSGLLNDFSEKTRALFIWANHCWNCGRAFPQDNGLTPHHIYKRSSNSPLNLAPLCYQCHELGDIHSKEKRAKYINQTLKYLNQYEYKLTDKDFQFLRKIK